MYGNAQYLVYFAYIRTYTCTLLQYVYKCNIYMVQSQLGDMCLLVSLKATAPDLEVFRSLSLPERSKLQECHRVASTRLTTIGRWYNIICTYFLDNVTIMVCQCLFKRGVEDWRFKYITYILLYEGFTHKYVRKYIHS